MTQTWEPVVHEPADTLNGALQRGLGRGAIRAATEPGAAGAVFRCLERDQRWDTQVDGRAVYLARLVRDLGMPVAPLLALLREPPEEDTFHNVSAVLTVLGRAGQQEAIAGLRRYVADGPRWAEVLEEIAADWPRQWWDDLRPVARERLAGGGHHVWWRSRPWRDGAVGDEKTADRRVGPGERPLGEVPAERLLVGLGAGRPGRLEALAELTRRAPQPGLVPLLDRLAAELPPGPGADRAMLSRAVRSLGAHALPVARRWAADPGHRMSWDALRLLAAHGGEPDVPVLLDGWDRLDDRPEDPCGYDDLAEGLARIGGAAAGRIVPRLHELWVTPHSYERAAYLRALLALDPDGAGPLLIEGLWDCEAAAREVAVAHVILTPALRVRLEQLRDDPVEEDAVRSAVAARLG